MFETHRIRSVVASLQRGEIVSYSEVALRAGNHRWARAVGAFLAEQGDDLPWWRVVRRDGSLAAPDRRLQRNKLIDEGISVRAGKVVGGVP